MNALDVFRFGEEQVRTVIVDGEPWFVATDILTILELDRTAFRRLEDDERGVASIHTLGGEQQVTTLNEPGLYTLILGSRKPDARAFKRWLTHDVIPQIRRNGKYAGAEHVEYQIPQTYAAALELAFLQAKELESKELAIAEAAPKVAAYNQLMDAEGFYTMEAAAKLGGIGRTTLFSRLRDAGVITRGGRLPMQRFVHWFKITTSSWVDGEGVAHLTQTARVRPDSLVKVLDKAGVKFSEVTF